MRIILSYKLFIALFFVLFIFTKSQQSFAQASSAKDTILSAAIVYNGDTIEAKTLDNIEFYSRYDDAHTSARAAWTRLRNAIYITFPYAKKAGAVINDINKHLANVSDIDIRKQYMKTREKELRKEFTEPLTNLSVY